MSKAIAIVYDQSFKPAIDSAMNMMHAIGDFMYGTDARTNLTNLFACGMLVVASLMSIYSHSVLPTVCSL